MARLSKKEKEEWGLFIDPVTGKRRYHDACRRCQRDCKQSFRARLDACPKYKSKRSKH